MAFSDGLPPEYVVFAGVNGAGKSTFYRTFAWTHAQRPQNMPRVNSDELLVASKGNWASAEDQVRAAKEAIKAIHRLMAQRRSFNQETTLSGHSAIKRIEEASRLGYRVRMFYIGIDSPMRAQERIAHREEIGGHGIAREVVERRYHESLVNLSKAVRVCDEVIILDNTREFVELARWNDGTLCWVGKLNQYGHWLIDAIQDDDVWETQ